MPTPRTCSHIKTNGVKCGSPALRHNTLCYFHYQWDRRERRRVRLGGPIGMNKNTGIELPILEGPESIMLAIMEVQRALLDARIDRQLAHTLLYSLQLAIQTKLNHSGLSDRHSSVQACPELDQELDLERARGLRPAANKCNSCRSQDSCTSPNNCRKISPSPSSRPERSGVEGPAVSPTGTDLSSNTSTPNPCHPERSAAFRRGVEGPFVSLPKPQPSTRGRVCR